MRVSLGVAMLKKCDDLDILGVTYDSKITYMQLRSNFTRFPELLLKDLIRILRKSWRLFHNRSPREMIPGVCTGRFGVTFRRIVLGYRYTP